MVSRVSTTPTAVGEPDLLDIILELNGRETLRGPAGSGKGRRKDPVRRFLQRDY
jgi:hypothetical protein